MILHADGSVTLDKHEAQELRVILTQMVKLYGAFAQFNASRQYVVLLGLTGALGEPE